MGWKLIWTTLCFIMIISVGCRRLLWPIIIGLLKVVDYKGWFTSRTTKLPHVICFFFMVTLHGTTSMVTYGRNANFKSFMPLTRYKPNVDQKEWTCTKNGCADFNYMSKRAVLKIYFILFYFYPSSSLLFFFSSLISDAFVFRGRNTIFFIALVNPTRVSWPT